MPLTSVLARRQSGSPGIRAPVHTAPALRPSIRPPSHGRLVTAADCERLRRILDWEFEQLGTWDGDLLRVRWKPTLGVPACLILRDRDDHEYFDSVHGQYYFESKQESRNTTTESGEKCWDIHWGRAFISRRDINRCSSPVISSSLAFEAQTEPYRARSRTFLSTSNHSASSHPHLEPSPSLGSFSPRRATEVHNFAHENSDEEESLERRRPPRALIPPVPFLTAHLLYDLVEQESPFSRAYLTPRGNLRGPFRRYGRGQHRVTRDLEFAPGFIAHGKSYNICDARKAEAALVHVIGTTARQPCLSCRIAGWPVLKGCVVFEGFGGGECTNCHARNKACNCSLHKRYVPPLNTPPSSDDHVDDDASRQAYDADDAAHRDEGAHFESTDVRDFDDNDGATSSHYPRSAHRVDAGVTTWTAINAPSPNEQETKHELRSSPSEQSSMDEDASENLYDFALNTLNDLDVDPAQVTADVPIKSAPFDEDYDVTSEEGAGSSASTSPEPELENQALKRSASPDGYHGGVNGLPGLDNMSGASHVPSPRRRKRLRTAYIPHEPCKVYSDTRFGGQGPRMSERQWEYIQQYASEQQRQRIRQHWLDARKNLYAEQRCSTMAFYQEDGVKFLSEEILPSILFPEREVIELDDD